MGLGLLLAAMRRHLAATGEEIRHLARLGKMSRDLVNGRQDAARYTQRERERERERRTHRRAGPLLCLVTGWRETANSP